MVLAGVVRQFHGSTDSCLSCVRGGAARSEDAEKALYGAAPYELLEEWRLDTGRKGLRGFSFLPVMGLPYALLLSETLRIQLFGVVCNTVGNAHSQGVQIIVTLETLGFTGIGAVP